MEISVAVAARPNVSPDEEVRAAVLADRLGYRELWIGGGWVWDSFALATAIGMATEQIALTVGPLPCTSATGDDHEGRRVDRRPRPPPGRCGPWHIERPRGRADARPLAASR
jgi:hypothetical protein